MLAPVGLHRAGLGLRRAGWACAAPGRVEQREGALLACGLLIRGLLLPPAVSDLPIDLRLVAVGAQGVVRSAASVRSSRTRVRFSAGRVRFIACRLVSSWSPNCARNCRARSPSAVCRASRCPSRSSLDNSRLCNQPVLSRHRPPGHGGRPQVFTAPGRGTSDRRPADTAGRSIAAYSPGGAERALHVEMLICWRYEIAVIMGSNPRFRIASRSTTPRGRTTGIAD
ncbi:hypothetical protein [Actinoplanes sp. DH11]|uniref:hypothetical protein n=1 Tax=Actinoplanes sp. DH11 TaxID=2857011 RepID=UPI001E628887|nr:hypothetical protein [Actinoplanes sp. DH11]